MYNNNRKIVFDPVKYLDRGATRCEKCANPTNVASFFHRNTPSKRYLKTKPKTKQNKTKQNKNKQEANKQQTETVIPMTAHSCGSF